MTDIKPIKDITKEDRHERTVSDNSPLLKSEPSFIFIKRKAEKIGGAVYLITNFFTQNEPLKWALRDDALSLIKDIIFLSHKHSSERDNLVRSIISRINQISINIMLAKTGGLVSPMNSEIIQEELSILLKRIEHNETKEESLQSFSFQTKYFAVDGIMDIYKGQSIGHTKGHENEGELNTLHTSDKQETGTTKKVIAPSSYREIKNTPTSVATNNAPVKGSINREQSILNALKERDFMSIKDFTSLITDCSEKTIQRELIALVEKGILKKTGERRWSTYSLAR